MNNNVLRGNVSCNHSHLNNIVLGKEEHYDAATLPCLSFKKVTDIVNGLECRFSNMAGGFPFSFQGREWANSEVLYLCGEFSNNTPEHQSIQEALCAATSGYAAKRFIKAKYKREVREDFKAFRLQWMLFVVWQKCKGNADFRKRLLATPEDSILIENTTRDNGGTAEVWGCRNKELTEARKARMASLQEESEGLTKEAFDHLINIEINKIQGIGTFIGQNNMGKILMLCRRAIQQGVEVDIDYELLSQHDIYIFGQRIDFSVYKQTAQRAESSKHLAPQANSKFFVEHAFFFLSHAQEILADSRMALAPVNVNNGLAYSGTGGFEGATLGVYLEWWQTCCNAGYEEEGHRWLVWHISGSPLSGCNACSAVNDEGKCQKVVVVSFSGLWHAFVKINQRNRKQMTGQTTVFTLEEVVNLLHAKEQGREEEAEEKQTLIIDNFFLRLANTKLQKLLSKTEQDRDEKHRLLVETNINFHLSEYRDLYNRYREEKAKVEQERAELYERRKELRRCLRKGEMNAKAYQSAVHPINEKLRKSPMELLFRLENELEERESVVSAYDLIDYFKKHNNQ